MNVNIFKEGWRALITLNNKLLAGLFMAVVIGAWFGVPRYVDYQTNKQIETQRENEIINKLSDLSEDVSSLTEEVRASAREEEAFRDSLGRRLLIMKSYQLKTVLNQSIIVRELEKTNKEISKQIEISNKAQEEYMELLGEKKNYNSVGSYQLENSTFQLGLGR